MKIVSMEVNNRRRDKRVGAWPIRVEIEGKVFQTVDWSLGGFLIEGYQGRRRPGEEILVEIQVEAEGVEYNHVARAEIVRLGTESGRLAANFVGLDGHAVDTLEGWMTGRLRRRRRRARARR